MSVAHPIAQSSVDNESSSLSLTLLSGDIVSLTEERHGHLTAAHPGIEPIPEACEVISHLRTTQSFTCGADLWDQAMFRIVLATNKGDDKVPSATYF